VFSLDKLKIGLVSYCDIGWNFWYRIFLSSWAVEFLTVESEGSFLSPEDYVVAPSSWPF
jgi:hypothetical protein